MSQASQRKQQPREEKRQEERESYQISSEQQLQHLAMLKQTNKKADELYSKYDNFFRTSTFAFIALGITVWLYNIPTFRQYAASNGLYVIQLSTFWWALAGFLFNYIGRKASHHLAQQYFQDRMHPKIFAYPQADQKQRLLIIIKQSYQAIYHLMITVICFALFYQEEWFPTCLGGFGRCDLILQIWPIWPERQNHYLAAFYNFQLGTYIFLCLDLLVFDYERFKTKNFGQLFFHHLITILLIVFSISYNFVAIGILIFFVHEVSDLFRSITRVVGDSWACIYYPNLAHWLNYFSLLVWVYARLLVYPFCIINEMYQGFADCYVKTPNLWPQGVYLIVLCCAIYAIQCYWAVLIYKRIPNQKAKNEPYVAYYLKEQQELKSKKN